MNESKIQLTERLRAEGRWDEANNFRETARADFRAKGMGRQEAVDAAWQAMAEAYPALPAAEATAAPLGNDSGRVRGMRDIPADWPKLPDNAALPAELGWVQAQRLRVVEERPSGATVVHLERAGSPPPSWAALGWLDTAIHNPAKWADICAKGMAQQDLEGDMVRREKKSIEEVRRLLAETVAAIK